MSLTKVKGSVWDSGDNGLFVSAKDFGAVGDGVTDDTTALTAFFSQISSSPGNYILPYGNYLTTAKQTISSSNSVLSAYGAKLTASGSLSSTDILQVTGNYVQIYGLHFNGASKTSVSGLRITGDHFTGVDLVASDCYEGGITSGGSSHYTYLLRPTTYRCKYTSSSQYGAVHIRGDKSLIDSAYCADGLTTGISVFSADDVQIVNANIYGDNITVGSTSGGIIFDGLCRNVQVRGGKIKDCVVEGIQVAGRASYGAATEGFLIDGVSIENCAVTGITIYADTLGYTKYGKISNCHIKSSQTTTKGIDVNGCVGVEIYSNTIDGYDQNIGASARADRIIIHDNLLYNGNTRGISMGSMRDSEAYSNEIHGKIATTSGVRGINSANTSGLRIYDNDIFDCLIGVEAAGSFSPTDRVINNNLHNCTTPLSYSAYPTNQKSSENYWDSFVKNGELTLVAGTKSVVHSGFPGTDAKVRLVLKTESGTVGATYINSKSASGFVVNSTSGSDTSTLSYTVDY